jgi:two-component system sensor kinase FixL
VRGFYALVLDATEKNAAREESKRLQDDLAHSSRLTTLGEFAGAIAHEINQPLSAIMSNANAAKRFLASSNPDLKEIEEILGDIVAEDARAGQVISRLRSLLKKAPSVFEKVDFNQLIDEVIGLVQYNAAMREVSISSDLAPDLPSIKGDRIQLQQVVLNLLTNAFEAVCEKPPGERQVCIRSWLEESAVHASISDNGAGIAAEEIKSVFKPFFTTRAQGLGMGLSISQSIITHHQGKIWAENNPDDGTTFYFGLPVESA